MLPRQKVYLLHFLALTQLTWTHLAS
ncbi:UNVERIFIED_CONTAM: hypothetical protein GTU68_029805 [Idotea baltica]|nr:hypothetical protein [Idotea baltica]